MAGGSLAHYLISLSRVSGPTFRGSAVELSAPPFSHMSTVGWWRGIYSAFISFNLTKRWFPVKVTLEHLLIGLPEVLWEKCVNDGVHGGIAVCQAVRGDSEEEGGGGQREDPKLSPEVDDVVRQPGDTKDHDHHQHGLRRLQGERRPSATIGQHAASQARPKLISVYSHGVKETAHLLQASPLLGIIALFKTSGPAMTSYRTDLIITWSAWGLWQVNSALWK